MIIEVKLRLLGSNAFHLPPKVMYENAFPSPCSPPQTIKTNAQELMINSIGKLSSKLLKKMIFTYSNLDLFCGILEEDPRFNELYLNILICFKMQNHLNPRKAERRDLLTDRSFILWIQFIVSRIAEREKVFETLILLNKIWNFNNKKSSQLKLSFQLFSEHFHRRKMFSSSFQSRHAFWLRW